MYPFGFLVLTTDTHQLNTHNNLDESIIIDNEENIIDKNIATNCKKTDDQKEFIMLDEQELAKWSLHHKISHLALNDLLKILKNRGHTYLPVDARTLLKTPRKVTITRLGTGKYWYNGIKKSLINILGNVNESKNLVLKFNVDGLPLGNSTRNQLWPILAQIDNLPNTKPVVIAIYFGATKPICLESFLGPFVNELSDLVQNGFDLNGFTISVQIKCFIADSPARAFIKGIFFNY